eukprot:349936-Lingulodinium_polyedra.AAC.1
MRNAETSRRAFEYIIAQHLGKTAQRRAQTRSAMLQQHARRARARARAYTNAHRCCGARTALARARANRNGDAR